MIIIQRFTGGMFGGSSMTVDKTLVSDGDRVSKGQEILYLYNDDYEMRMKANHSGLITLQVSEEDTVSINDIVWEIETEC